MSKISKQSIPITIEIDTDTLLESISKLSTLELEKFIFQLKALLNVKKAKSKKHRIQELTELIHQSALASDKRKRYGELALKLERQIMTERERQEFLVYTKEEEAFRNQRLSYMIELSFVRQIPFAQIMKEFPFKSSVNS